jgi:hypothetical protein
VTLPATPQRTADARVAARAPMTAPDMTCVVESGKPTPLAEKIAGAPDPRRRRRADVSSAPHEGERPLKP